MKEAISEVGDFVGRVRFVDNTTIIAKTQEDQLQDMMNTLVDTGKKYGMKINIKKITNNEGILEK